MHERDEIADKMRRVAGLVTDVDGVLTNGTYPYGADGELLKLFHTHDEVGLQLARCAGWPVVVITQRQSAMVARWAADMGLEQVHQGVADKRECLAAVAGELGLSCDQFCYLGDDLLDLPAMDLCGLRAAPADATVLVRRKVDLVLELPGGRGVLRELVERVLEAQGRCVEVIRAYLNWRECATPGELIPAAGEGDVPKIGFRR